VFKYRNVNNYLLQELGKIIQRDFFPDLEKLKAQNDYLDALQNNDVIKIRELYSKYSGRKPSSNRDRCNIFIILIQFGY